MRALVVAAAGMVVGSLLVLMAHLLYWPILLTGVGLLVLMVGFGVFVAAWWLAHSMRAEVILDDDGYQLRGPRVTGSGAWADIERVTQDQGRITFHRKDGSRAQLQIALGAAADLDALGADIASRLDFDRGYGTGAI